MLKEIDRGMRKEIERIKTSSGEKKAENNFEEKFPYNSLDCPALKFSAYKNK